MLSRILKRSYSYDLKTVVRAVSPQQFTETIVDDHIRVFEQTTKTDTPRPLAIVLGWLMGKPEHVRKYSEIYLSHGFDVIQVQAHLKVGLISKNGKNLAEKVLQICEEENRKTQPIFVHALSIGGYIYLEILTHSTGKYKDIQTFSGRLHCQIFDSPVHVPSGEKAISKIATNNPLLQHMIEMTSNVFYSINQKSRKDFINAFGIFEANVNRTPTLLLCSRGDALFEEKVFATIMETQSKRGIDVRCMKWETPRHVSIYREYPEEYRLVVKTFIDEHMSQQICTHL